MHLGWIVGIGPHLLHVYKSRGKIQMELSWSCLTLTQLLDLGSFKGPVFFPFLIPMLNIQLRCFIIWLIIQLLNIWQWDLGHLILMSSVFNTILFFIPFLFIILSLPIYHFSKKIINLH